MATTLKRRIFMISPLIGVQPLVIRARLTSFGSFFLLVLGSDGSSRWCRIMPFRFSELTETLGSRKKPPISHSDLHVLTRPTSKSKKESHSGEVWLEAFCYCDAAPDPSTLETNAPPADGHALRNGRSSASWMRIRGCGSRTKAERTVCRNYLLWFQF